MHLLFLFTYFIFCAVAAADTQWEPRSPNFVQVCDKEEDHRQRSIQLLESCKRKDSIITMLEEKVGVLENRVMEMDRERRNTSILLREQQKALDKQAKVLSEQAGKTSAVDWTIQRDEVKVTSRRLGKGAWATVSVGVFRGSEVAVKKIHDLILSDFNRELFKREMQIAARCRHPCLLQFIGATTDDGPALLVTELLETSLRSVLSKRSLLDSETLTIAWDVSRALNYLHLSRPSPIIHRDVSSANVLLWRAGPGGWRAKLSDYGTANFMRQCGTANPGAPLYVAPEALEAAKHSPKVYTESKLRNYPHPLPTRQTVEMRIFRIV